VPLNKCTDFESKLWKEQFNAMERAFKLEERKCIFVVALFGIGGVGFVNGINNSLFYLYFLVPLIAIAFDVLILSQKYSIRRIGYFLSISSRFDLERDWENFVDKNRENRVSVGAETFTILSFATSFWVILDKLYDSTFHNIPYVAYAWFILLLIFSVWATYSRTQLILKLKKTKT
jgi:hypothetical protein